MNLVNLLKKKLANEIRKQHMALRQRRQLNMTVDVRLIDETKELAAQFTIPRYCLVEHLLEVGCYYLTRAMENEDKTKMLRHHLDSMGPAFFFTHEINIERLDGGVNGLDRAFDGVIKDLKKFYDIIPCGLDEICQYGKNIRTAELETADCDNSVGKLTISWKGFSDMPTKFHLFTEANGKIVDKLYDLHVFRGNTEVTINY